MRNEPLGVTQKQFYIANVVDNRDNRNNIGQLLSGPTGKGNQFENHPVNIAGGFTAVRQFIMQSLPANKALRPVVISLQKLTVKENLNSGNQIEGRVSLQLSFYLKNGEDENVHLVDYNGSATYSRPPGQDPEPILKQSLKSGIIYLVNWMNTQSATNIKLATGVKVIFTDYTEAKEGDTIYYAVNRPVKWIDFQSKTPASRYDAEVFPGIGYDEHTEIINGIVNIHLSIKAYLPKSACWVKDGDRNDYALNHEQRHFDIVKIIAEHFKQKLKAENLPVSNFDGFINVDYLDAFREMNDMQKQYDDETRHGIDTAAQQHWNDRIDKELKAYGVK